MTTENTVKPMILGISEKTTVTVIEKGVAEGIWRFLIQFAISICLISILMWAFFAIWPKAYDATDNAMTGTRSGMSVLTDHGTGCEYLVTREGGLTPRLKADGLPSCGS